MKRIVTWQDRVLRCESGGEQVIRHRYVDEPASMGSALAHMLRLSEEECRPLLEVDRAMGLLGGEWLGLSG